MQTCGFFSDKRKAKNECKMEDINIDSLQMTGITNAMKTGNLHFDLLLAMAIPLFLRMTFSALRSIDYKGIWESIKSFFLRAPPETKYYERTIIHRTEKEGKNSSFANVDADTQNHVLVKAIMMYLHHLKCLNLKQANLELTSIKAETGSDSKNNDDYYYYYSDSDSEEEEDDNALYATLSKLSIIKKPPEEEWHSIGKYFSGPEEADTKKNGTGKNNPEAEEDQFPSEGHGGEESKVGLFDVEFCIGKDESDNVEEEGEGNQKTTNRIQKRETKLTFRSLGEHSIDKFIDSAYSWYLDEIKKLGQDEARFYYEMKDDSEAIKTYKRYKLSNEKTFESLFFQEKTTIVKLFDNFINGTGRYGIKGYPQKLGLLLYGPPGTGKTSLIKAVAEYTGRSIVNVPLAMIKTNSELSSIFFGNSFNVEGEYYPVKMGFKDVVFVMEDVDAASKVVKRRDGKKTASVTRTEHVELPVPRSMWRLLLESQKEPCIELVKMLLEKSERLKKEAQAQDTLSSFAERMTSLPGLSLAGHEGDIGSSTTVQKIASEALESANKMMENSKKLDEYLEFHARMIKSLLEKGAKIGKEFENELLGVVSPPSSIPSSYEDKNGSELPGLPTRGRLSRNVSYERYDNDPTNHFVEVASPIVGGRPMMATPMGLAGIPYSVGNDGTITTGGAGFAAALNQLGNASLGSKGMVDSFKDDLDVDTLGPGSKPRGGGYGKLGFGGGMGFGGGIDWKTPVKDQLNLSGLLNVLDGVVDTPGRILIMTTNHPEVLDPALIRPGRIDKRLILGYMHSDDVVQMLNHYYQTNLDPIQVDRVGCAVRGDGVGRSSLSLTPAQVEQLTAEHDDVNDMISALERKGRSTVPPLSANPRATANQRGNSTMSFDGLSPLS